MPEFNMTLIKILLMFIQGFAVAVILGIVAVFVYFVIENIRISRQRSKKYI